MKIQNIIQGVGAYALRHWFKFFLLAVILIACNQKDLHFSINFKDEPKQVKTSNKEVMTHNLAAAEVRNDNQGSFWDIFSFGKSSNTMQALDKIDEKTKEEYLRRFVQVANNEHTRYGIPASVILAMALRQSYAGKRDVAFQGNNHFALTCDVAWQGARSDLGGTCYRSYDNAWSSFRDFSTLISTGEYAQLKTDAGNDYKAWANGLGNLDIADAKNLSNDLISIIEQYQLYTLDK